MATTTKGFSYILGSDSASSIDDISLALANTLDANIPFRMSAGQGSITLATAASGSVAVTFPTSRFTVAPLVICSLSNAPSGSQKLSARAINASTTGATLWVYTGDQTNVSCTVTVAWWAIQFTTTTANG